MGYFFTLDKTGRRITSDDSEVPDVRHRLGTRRAMATGVGSGWWLYFWKVEIKGISQSNLEIKRQPTRRISALFVSVLIATFVSFILLIALRSVSVLVGVFTFAQLIVATTRSRCQPTEPRENRIDCRTYACRSRSMMPILWFYDKDGLLNCSVLWK